jgi:hypothetical protein
LCINSATSSLRSRDESVQPCKLNWWASGSNRISWRLSPNEPRALAKYSKQYPEAVRSLAEEEEKTLTLYELPKAACTDTFRRPMPPRVSQSNVRQRTDQIDVFRTETSGLTIVWATIQDIRLHKLSLE